MANNGNFVPSANSPWKLVYQVIDDEHNLLARSLLEALPATPINDLQKQIFSNHKTVLEGHSVDAAQLILWKVLKPPQIVKDDTANDELLAAFYQDAQSFAEKLVPVLDVSDYFEEEPPRKCLHLIVQVPRGATAEGKRKREDPVDISKKLSKVWDSAPPIIQATELALYLDTPLKPEEKIPISDFQWRNLLLQDMGIPEHCCFPEDLEILFDNTEDETAPSFWHTASFAILGAPPDSLGTENSFISFWDINILRILLLCLGAPRWVRNSNKGTETGSLRPDFGLLLKSACIFRGEEKSPTYTGHHPRDELAGKTRWVYDPLPYILGYYAIGASVTIVAIQPGPDKQSVQDILTSDLSTRKGRIINLARMMNLVRVLRALERNIEKGVDADMLPVLRDGGKKIERFEKKIRKTYPVEDKLRVSFLIYVYDQLEAKEVPNVDHLVRFELSHPQYGCFVEFEPRGSDTGPSSADDVKNAVISVLKALKVLHGSEPQIFHRDIRWPNVMQNLIHRKEWFLIDWEDAAIAPTKAAPNLRHGTHAPQVFQDGHGAEVDLWGVGRLIVVADVPALPEDLLSLGKRMVDGSIVSAGQALDVINSL